MTRLVVTDWNGTLLADTRACLDADNYVLEKFNGNPIDLKTYRETIIIPAIDFYCQHGLDRAKLVSNYDEISELFHEFYEQRAAKCRTRRGAKKVLNWLKQQSIDTTILSNHTLEGIESQLQRLKIADYISCILANSEKDSAMKERNKQKRLAHYLQDHEYDPRDLIIIGDAPEEVEIGKELNLKTVAITDGYYATSRLKASDPDYLITNLIELIDIIRDS